MASRSRPNVRFGPRFQPLYLNSIRPEGRLTRQLCIRADGLSGHEASSASSSDFSCHTRVHMER